jgi:hypothetical protein
VVLSNGKKQDGVQLEQAKTMAWSEISEASWNGANTRPELDGLAVMFWTRRRMISTKGSGRRRSYQEFQDDEASPMAKQERRRCPIALAIPR